MSEESSAPGVSRDAIETALADPALASLDRAGAPIILAHCETLQAVHANQAAFDLLGRGLPELTQRLFHGAEPAAERFATLARILLPGAAARLERLRFYFGPVSENLMFLCRRSSASAGQTLLVLAAPGVRAALYGRAQPQLKAVPSAPVSVASSGEAAEAVKDGLVAGVAAAASSDAQVPEPSEALATPKEPDAAARARPRLSKFRFLWRTDRDHRFVEVAPAFLDFLGQTETDLVGHSFVEAARDLGLDPQGRLVAALASRSTWSGVDVSWPLHAGKTEAAPVRIVPKRLSTDASAARSDAVRQDVRVTLGALPAFDAAKLFDGYRGYGLVHCDALAFGDAVHRSVIPAGNPPTNRSLEESAAALPASEKPEISAAPAVGAEAAAAQRDESDAAVEGTKAASGAEPESAARAHELSPAYDNVVPIRPLISSGGQGQDGPAPQPAQFARAHATPGLSTVERDAFQEIARALSGVTAASVDHSTTEAARHSEEHASENGAADKTAIEENADFVNSEPLLTTAADDAAPSASDGPHMVVAASAADISSVATNSVTETAPSPAAASSIVAKDLHDLEVSRNGRNILERIPVGILVTRQGIPIYANRTLLDLTGYADADELHQAGGAGKLFQGKSDSGGPAKSGAAEIVTRDGETIAVDARVQAIDWDGLPATLISLRRARDTEIAARVKELEGELRQQEGDARELHAILDTATDGVAVLDPQGKIISLNRSAEALFGCEQSEVAGEHMSALVAPESHAAISGYLDGLASGGVASVLNDGREIVGRAARGGTIPLFVTIGRVGSGSHSKFCAVLRDLTAWKKAEHGLNEARREAERASGLKSDFLAKISHEIRTPLNAIIGFAEVIMDERFGPVGNERYKDYMKDIHRSGEHVMSLVNDLLDLSKIEAGKMDMVFTAVDANAIVSECVSIMQPQANRERVVMRLSLAPRLPKIVADERSIRQIVLNILSNAVKFNEPGGQVIVSTALTDAGSAVVRVRDTGLGMSDGELQVALEPFRQVATSRVVSGTGLGLPLTKALVEANRAGFTIKSRKTEGTLVEVTFPPTRVLAE